MAVTTRVTVSGTPIMLHLPSWHAKDAAGLRAVIAVHGHGGHEYQIQQGGQSPFAGHPEYLADHGYAVACGYTGDQWLNPASMTVLTTVYNYLVTTLGANGPKVGLFGWSMGGGNALRWAAENPTKVAAGYLCSPLTDLDWAHAQAAWTAEIDTAYSNNYTVNGSPRSPVTNAATYRGGARFLIGHATNDATVPYTQTTAFITAVNDSAVTLRQPDILGDHQGGLTQVPPRETWEWLRTQWAA